MTDKQHLRRRLAAARRLARLKHRRRSRNDKQHLRRRLQAAQAKFEEYTVGGWKAAVARGVASQWLACKQAAQERYERLYARIK